MKQSDIFTLILIAGIGTIAAFFVCQTIMGDPNKAVVSFKTVKEVVSNGLVAPDPEVFNSTAINPTVEVYVGECEDRDKNGILDEEELKVCQCAKYDENQDGVISDEEWTVCQNGGAVAEEQPGESPEG